MKQIHKGVVLAVYTLTVVGVGQGLLFTVYTHQKIGPVHTMRYLKISTRRSMSRVTPYVRQTMLALTELSDEGSSFANDFVGDGVTQAARREALDSSIRRFLNDDALKVIGAFEMANITAEQAAKVIYLAGLFADTEAGG